jgi:hypothetical protein
MPALDNIFPAANSAIADDNETAVSPGAHFATGEPFDQVMSRALSPRETNAPAVQNRRQPANFSSVQKRNSVDQKSSLKPVSVTDDSSTADASAQVKTKDGTPKADEVDTDANRLAQSGAGDVLNAAQTAPIVLSSPMLAACLLKPPVPAVAPKSEANNPAVAAVLPAGAEGKNGAATGMVPAIDAAAKQSVADSISQLESGGLQKAAAAKNSGAGKTLAKTTAANIAVVSAATPKISELAGAVDATPKKVETVSSGDSSPDASDHSFVLQNPAAESAAVVPAKSHGTSVAKQDVPMKNAEQTNKVAGLAGSGEKVLPGDAVDVVRAAILPGRGSSIPVSARVQTLEMNSATAPVVPENTVRSNGPADEAAVVSNTSDIRSQALDRTQDLMTLHASRLVDAKTDSLQVVIKPDTGTQLSLELRQRGGGIEAQAILQKGDFENLKQHWPELQQRLEQRGIKLAPLTSTENQTSWSGSQGFKQQPDQPAEREPLLAGAFAGFVPAGAMTHLPAEPAGQAASSRGWQSWA